MGFLDKLLGRTKKTEATVADKAKDVVERDKDDAAEAAGDAAKAAADTESTPDSGPSAA